MSEHIHIEGKELTEEEKRTWVKDTVAAVKQCPPEVQESFWWIAFNAFANIKNASHEDK